MKVYEVVEDMSMTTEAIFSTEEKAKEYANKRKLEFESVLIYETEVDSEKVGIRLVTDQT